MTIGIILLVIAAGELVLGLWFITQRSRNQTTLWYGLFALGSAVYVGANGLGFVSDVQYGKLAENFAWAGGAIATAFFLPFSYSFPIPRRPLRELVILALWPALLFIPGFLFSGAFITQQRIVHFGNGYKTAQGPYMWFFLVFLAVYWLWSLANLIGTIRRSDGTNRRNTNIILGGTLVSLVLTSYFDVFIPLTEPSRVGYIGSLMTIVWLGSALYVLMKK